MTWLRWVFVCHFGKRCADPVVENLLPVGHSNPPPPELFVVLTWNCGGCGRHYEKKVRASDVFRANVRAIT